MLRVACSALLLLLGAATYLTSLFLPAVRLDKKDGGGVFNVGGWTAATHHGPAGPTNSFLVLAFLVWAAAHWFRSILAWWLGVAMAAYAVVFHAAIGAWPGYEGITDLRAGYWTWLAATVVTATAFVVLPKPVRPPPGERISRADVDRGRLGLAQIVGGAAVVALLWTHLLVPTPVASREVAGEPPPGAFDGYNSGPFRSSGYSTREVALPDGTKYEEKFHTQHDLAPLVVAQWGDRGAPLLEFALLALPLLLVAAMTTRRALLRWLGAAVATAAALGAFLGVDDPWPLSSFGLHPLTLAWRATPTAFALAFVLLPPRRGTEGS